MADAPAKKTAEKAPEPKTEPPRQLARASEATDPAVHHLLAELQTARMNADADKVDVLTKQLAELGYC